MTKKTIRVVRSKFTISESGDKVPLLRDPKPGQFVGHDGWTWEVVDETGKKSTGLGRTPLKSKQEAKQFAQEFGDRFGYEYIVA